MIQILDALLIAEVAIKIGKELISQLKEYEKDTITHEEFKKLFNLPNFSSFSKKKQVRKNLKMSNFNKAFDKIVIGYEGGFSGYVNDPDDPGEETYAGISRRSNPEWAGWAIIDSAKGSNFPKNLNHIPGLKDLVKLRFKEHYWDQIEGDNLPLDLSVELFDNAVHISPYKAIKFLQIGLNKLNRNERNYNNIVVDGKLGNQTRGALTAFIKSNKLYRLVKVINILQGNHYLNLMESNEIYEKYIGWFDRVEL